ncbi:enoyl-CoA hydratase [Rhizobium laguerreae]|uniref:Enoyl-CoA hydratase n=1 Tax=Rhizobium laguerreae TaxID=1076926 RepID=A0AB35FDG6_9HYPH|nr:enoyl-CoA hydratase [Rhizobium laguerreae]MBY3064678.1 enoyl-CoA hydratase [Rhizobium laguerreae]MBY3307789.1 enoyl-CoA hydratase [Rhizobium laguerreae]
MSILKEQLGKVLRLTLNRPEVRNAQSMRLLRELDENMVAAASDDTVSVIILAGAGKDFSAGHDLGSPQAQEDERLNPPKPGIDQEYDRILHWNVELCLRWRNLPKPTIAQVQGNCIMGGLMLASCCDLIVASEDAVFADRAVAWGGAHVQYFTLPWDVGPRKAKEFLFTAGPIDALEAHRLGLVNRLVPRDQLQDGTMELAQSIARQDLFALRLAKLSVNEALDRQGQTEAINMAFKNYMMALPYRKERGSFGGNAATARERLERYNKSRD